jgi:hypothetical protein
MNKTIFTYYQSIPSANQREEFACANAWKASWEKNGWTTSLLNKSHASSTKLYTKLMQKLIKTSMHDSICSRYVRWCALQASGGGWMCDYDVANVGFTPEKAQEIDQSGKLHIIADEPCYLFYATKDQAADVIMKFVEGDIGKHHECKNESDVIKEYSSLSPIVPFIYHAIPGKEESKSEQMAKQINA